MKTLHKIENQGFTVTLMGEFFEISPADRLTTLQCDFLKQHKAEIISELKAAQALTDRLLLDDRRYCYECQNLRGNGICLIAKQGKMDRASRYYKPVDICPRRCIHFVEAGLFKLH